MDHVIDAGRYPPIRIVEVDGRPISYRRQGDGPALVLLHGFTHDSRAWGPQLQDLSREFTVVAWDAPGAGHSPDPEPAFTYADWARALAGFLDAIGIGRAHVVGLSWGGVLAQEMVQAAADRVATLVLADTYAGWKGSLPDPLPEERLQSCLQDSLLTPEEFVPRYLPGMFGPGVAAEIRQELGSIMADFHPAGFRQMATALARADTRELLGQIAKPTLLIWGDADTRSPMFVAEQLHGLIAGSQLRVLRGAGHVTNLERPEEFDAAVRSFLGASTS